MKTISILGCGDFLNIQAPALLRSREIRVGLLYDPDQARAERFAAKLNGQACTSAEDVINDKETDIVGIFVPPWIRRELFEKTAAAGKAIIATKPLAPISQDAQAMVAVAKSNHILCGLIYNRTESPAIEALKEVFETGTFGKLALYRQDWMHAYPMWNKWAVDPKKNGGPFMDAMIHNLNIASYLMGRPLINAQWVSQNLAHPELACADTEAMTAYYKDNGMASLFISWAADLATYSFEGNDREHLDVCYMVTDQGWRISLEEIDRREHIRATRQGEVRYLPVPPFPQTHFDLFAQALEQGTPLPRRFATITEAAKDIDQICQYANNSPSS